MHTTNHDPLHEGAQHVTRPNYRPETWRDYVPPAVFSRVRAPVALPRANLKPQTSPYAAAAVVERAPVPATVERAPVPMVAPRRSAAATDALVRAALATAPAGSGMTLRALRLRSHLGVVSIRRALARLGAAGAVESRILISVQDGIQSGRVAEYRGAQACPWGPPPDGTRLPGQRPLKAQRIEAGNQ